MHPTPAAPVILVVPADPAFVRIVRLVVSSVAADLEFDLDEIDDLRIVADELVNAVMAAAGANAAVRVTIAVVDSALTVEASAASAASSRLASSEPGLDPLAAQIVTGIVESFAFDVVGDSVVAGFRSHPPLGLRCEPRRL